MEADEIIHVHLIFKGRVQGVGFRATALRFANNLSLKGTASNLSDSSVEIFVQGKKSLINEFVKEIKDYFGGYIEEVIVRNNEIPSIHFTSFKILH